MDSGGSHHFSVTCYSASLLNIPVSGNATFYEYGINPNSIHILSEDFDLFIIVEDHGCFDFREKLHDRPHTIRYQQFFCRWHQDGKEMSPRNDNF